MSDKRHRGAAPKDAEHFAHHQLVALRAAVSELSWLLTRGYVNPSALKLVGDRHALHARQRRAVERCACTDTEQAHRRAISIDSVAGRRVFVDGFNALIVSEGLLGGAPVFRGRDGLLRDIASVHGTYRRVEESGRALEAFARALHGARSVRFYFDQPVSNSGRVAQRFRDFAASHHLTWEVDVVRNPDTVLAEADADIVCATADGWILDRAGAALDLPNSIRSDAASAWIVDLSD